MGIYKHLHKIFLVLGLFISAYIFFIAVNGQAYNNSLIQRLNGYVLLQVEDYGEAWYIDPVSDTRIYMRDGQVAYDVMANLGLGINDADLAKIRVGIDDRFECSDRDNDGLCDKLEEGLETSLDNADSDGDSYDDRTEVLNGYNPLGPNKLNFDQDLADRLRGRIVLQVEKNGQAWYINPQNGLRYYMKDGEAAYQIMRFLSLGITNNDLEQIPISDFQISEETYLPGPGLNDDLIEDPVCGNDILETGEECDGILGVTIGYQCNVDCVLEEIIPPVEMPVCGNNILEIDEECDGTSGVTEGHQCNNSCQLEKISVDSNPPNNDPICGNNILEIDEECDGNAGVTDGYQCTAACILEEIVLEINYSMLIKQPYENTDVLVQSDVPEASSYQWKIDNQVMETDVVPTIFLAHFDNSLDTVNDEVPIVSENISFEGAKFGQGMQGIAEYQMANNIDMAEGTIDIWLKLKQNLDNPVFDTNPYIFRYVNNDNDNFYFRVRTAHDLVFGIYDDSNGWSNATQLSTQYYNISDNELAEFTFTWSRDKQSAQMYLNGEQISRHDYSGDFPNIEVDDGTFVIGNPNVVLDEFRILNKVLSTDEIRENYKRGIPFSNSDIVYSGEISNDQIIDLSINTDQGELNSSAIVKKNKININSPDGYFVPNTQNIGLQFSTPTDMTCYYGDTPDIYDNLPHLAVGIGTSHNISQPISDIVEQYSFAIKCKSNTGDGDDYGFFRQYRILPDVRQTYPKISKLWWGNVPTDEEVAYLSKFDIVSVSKSAITRPSIIRHIKEANPNEIILIYKGAIGTQDFSGVEYKTLHERLNDSMRLQRADGSYCINYYFDANSTVYNLYIDSSYDDVVAKHMEKDIFDRTHYVDGIWWDVTGPSFWFLKDPSTGLMTSCDFDMDGVDEDLNNSTDTSYAKDIWITGMHQQMQNTYDRLGHNVLTIGNSSGSSPDHSDYHGNLWEETFKHNVFDNYFDVNYAYGFFNWQTDSLEPRLNDNLFSNTYLNGSSDYYRYHRYGMAASIIAGVYYNPTTYNNNRQVNWFDEYWVDKISGEVSEDRNIGSGYLGLPIGPAYQLYENSNVWRRDFENGIVLVNNNLTATSTLLNGQFRFIVGLQDSVANSGGNTENVNLSSLDGRIFLRPLCSDNPYDDPWCIE